MTDEEARRGGYECPECERLKLPSEIICSDCASERREQAELDQEMRYHPEDDER